MRGVLRTLLWLVLAGLIRNLEFLLCSYYSPRTDWLYTALQI